MADGFSELAQVLKKMVRHGHRRSDDSESDSDSGEWVGGHADRARQMSNFRRHKRHPGRLAEKALSLMDLHVGDRMSPGSTLAPIVTTYVTNVMFTQLGKEKMGLRNSREALTLAHAMDSLLRGEPSSAMDILAQRLVALERSVVDQNWSVARWMELIPTGDAQLSTQEAAQKAQKIESAERALKSKDPR